MCHDSSSSCLVAMGLSDDETILNTSFMEDGETMIELLCEGMQLLSTRLHYNVTLHKY